ncbi:unnamed protein product [Brassicogethes aeneus]|uniref:BUB1 N-terminal domain-containing protein n=1 Tax=Brassicogethes aeneus TaxID=1431903 RepID=A0A9P0FF67_BRAAE|nr:unnamed protein product [Brassicogethes aeneus]
MDFDLSKEMQPSIELQIELEKQKEEIESAIRNYNGEDPLDNYYHYISWVEQSYPKHGHTGNLVALLGHCLGKFENDARYSNDRRFCKLWIKFIDLQENPIELYNVMHARNLCRGWADLYVAWAHYHEVVGDFLGANNVIELGKRALANPNTQIDEAHISLLKAVGQYHLHGPDVARRCLIKKRHALTSLISYKPARGESVRLATGNGAGVLPSFSILSVARRSTVHEDKTKSPEQLDFHETVPRKNTMNHSHLHHGFDSVISPSAAGPSSSTRRTGKEDPSVMSSSAAGPSSSTRRTREEDPRTQIKRKLYIKCVQNPTQPTASSAEEEEEEEEEDPSMQKFTFEEMRLLVSVALRDEVKQYMTCRTAWTILKRLPEIKGSSLAARRPRGLVRKLKSLDYIDFNMLGIKDKEKCYLRRAFKPTKHMKKKRCSKKFQEELRATLTALVPPESPLSNDE